MAVRLSAPAAPAPRPPRLAVAEYNFLDRPYGDNPAFAKYKKLASYAGNSYTRNWVVNEKEHPTTGTPYSWVRARVLGGKTNFWGRVAIRYGPLQFQAASRDGFDIDWPFGYEELKPYYDKVDVLLGVSGTKEGLDQVPDGIYQRAHKLNCVEVHFKDAVEKMGRRYIAGRAGVTTDGVLGNKYRARCLGRGRCSRGCDIGATFHSPTALIFPARDSGNCTVRPYSVASEVFLDPETGRAGGVRVIDANTREVMDFKAKVVVLGAGCLDSTRILLNSKSARHPNGMGNSSGLLGCYLSEHHMGPRGSGFIPTRIGTEPTLDDGRPTSPYIPRFRNVTDKHPDFIRGYHFQGGGGAYEYPSHAHDTPGFGKGFKSSVRKYYPAQFAIGGFGEVLPRKENRVSLDAEVKDAWGIPAAALPLPVQRQRDQDGEGHGATPRRRCSARRARRTSRSTPPCSRPAGRSTRSAPRAWATIRRPRSPTATAACTTCPTCTWPTRRRSSPAARRTRPGRSSPCAGGPWTT